MGEMFSSIVDRFGDVFEIDVVSEDPWVSGVAGAIHSLFLVGFMRSTVDILLFVFHVSMPVIGAGVR
jgi:hypothetical protein